MSPPAQHGLGVGGTNALLRSIRGWQIALHVSNGGHRFRIWRQPLARTRTPSLWLPPKRASFAYLQSGDAQRLIQLNLATKQEKPLRTLRGFPCRFRCLGCCGRQAFLRRPGGAGALRSTTVRGRSRQRPAPCDWVATDAQSRAADRPGRFSRWPLRGGVAQVDIDDARLMLVRLGR
jgi:hypothetical protein